MTAFNVVRFRVKPGKQKEFVDIHRRAPASFKGFVRGNLIQTGSQTYCMIGEWRDARSMRAANPQMIAILNSFRHLLASQGRGLGVTDPVSGKTIFRMQPSKATPTRKRAKVKRRRKSAPRSRRR